MLIMLDALFSQFLIWIQFYKKIPLAEHIGVFYFISSIMNGKSNHFIIFFFFLSRWTESCAFDRSAGGGWCNWHVSDHRSSAKPLRVEQWAYGVLTRFLCSPQEPEHDCGQHSLSWYETVREFTYFIHCTFIAEMFTDTITVTPCSWRHYA